jgi:hypothetical protein
VREHAAGGRTMGRLRCRNGRLKVPPVRVSDGRGRSRRFQRLCRSVAAQARPCIRGAGPDSGKGSIA